MSTFTVSYNLGVGTPPTNHATLADAHHFAGPHNHLNALVTYDEAVAIVKRSKGCALFISAGQEAPCADPAKAGRAFHLSCNVPVSKRDALRCLDRLYGERFKTEALVRLAFLGTCLFIGSAV